MIIKVKCDVSGNELSLRDGHFVANTQTGEWAFCSTEYAEKFGNYCVDPR
jgi:hypothetical protein